MKNVLEYDHFANAHLWQVTWLHHGFGWKVAELPNEYEARRFAQITALLSDCRDVRVLPPLGRLDLSPAQVASSAAAPQG